LSQSENRQKRQVNQPPRQAFADFNFGKHWASPFIPSSFEGAFTGLISVGIETL
jgi:hypothetical protein